MQAQQTEQITTEKTAAVDAVALLESQHREVEVLFKEFEGASDKAFKKKEKIAAAICEKLTMHAKIEESVFYPAAKEADDDLVLESFEEHANVKAMIRKISRTAASDETYDAKVTVLKDLVEHHVKEEEEDLFPKCRKALGDEAILDLGAKMQAKMERLEAMN